MKKIQAELSDKAEVTMVEMGNDKTKFEGAMQDASESDADLIITGLWDMKEITVEDCSGISGEEVHPFRYCRRLYCGRPFQCIFHEL